MKIFIYTFRKTSTFKIFGILMLSSLTLYYIIQNSAKYNLKCILWLDINILTFNFIIIMISTKLPFQWGITRPYWANFISLCGWHMMTHLATQTNASCAKRTRYTAWHHSDTDCRGSKEPKTVLISNIIFVKGV